MQTVTLLMVMAWTLERTMRVFRVVPTWICWQGKAPGGIGFEIGRSLRRAEAAAPRAGFSPAVWTRSG
jgi:hypothetical protein